MKNHQDLWKEEYTRKGIPSSYRSSPTKIVTHFASFLKNHTIPSGNLLDLGCGKGRNTFYLENQGYRVTCFDFVAENIDEINRISSENNLKITAVRQDLSQRWPAKDRDFDAAIDIFCYKHIVDKKAQKHYRTELFSALKDKGYFLISLAADDDGFYGSFLEKGSGRKQIIDPYSKLPSFLYSLEELIEEFSDLFTVCQAEKASSTSPMYGKEYQRSVLHVIFQKK